MTLKQKLFWAGMAAAAAAIVLAECASGATTAEISFSSLRTNGTVAAADVVQGAVMQGKVDLLRMSGEVGINSRGAQGESTSYQTTGIIKEVADLWAPYRMLA